MALSRFVLPYADVGAGIRPSSGAKLFFYATGTSTPKSTFTDATGGTANTNPVIANANGVFPAIFLDGIFNVALKDSNDVQIWTSDPYTEELYITNSPVFATVAAMEAATPLATDGSPVIFTVGMFVSVVDYATGNNSGALIGSIVAGGTGTADGGSYINLANGTQWKQLFKPGGVNFKLFGAVGDSSNDDTSAMQAAINTRLGINDYDNSTYRITQSLNILFGGIIIDLGMSSIVLDDPTGLLDHIILGDGVTQYNDVRILNCTFGRTQVATAGAAISVRRIGLLQIKGNRIYGDYKIFNGIDILNSIISKIQTNYIDNVVNKGISLQGTGLGGDKCIDTTIIDNRIDGGINSITTYDYVEGLFMKENILFNPSASGMTISASSNANGLISFKIMENDFDTCGGSGLFVDKINNIQIINNWFASNTGDDLDIRNEVGGVIISGNQIYPAADGIVLDCSQTVVANNLVSGGVNCIKLNSNATNCNLTGNSLSFSTNGINLVSATNTSISTNKIFTVSGSAITGTAGSNISVKDNEGDTSVGTTSFASIGSSPFTYTAGIRPEQISVYAGTVSSISVNGNNMAFTSNRSVYLSPNESLIVTYSSVPYILSRKL